MTYGLQVFNSSGVIIIDVSSRLPRFVASGATGSVPGYSSVPIYISGMENTDEWLVGVYGGLTGNTYNPSKSNITKYSGYFTITNTESEARTYNWWVHKS